MLIIEGADCLGKTTFINALIKRANEMIEEHDLPFPIFYSHMSRPNCAFDFFDDYKDMITTFAVQDRFHLGGIVWHDAIPQERLEIIEGWLRAVGSMVIVLYASDTRWYEKWLTNDKRGNLLPDTVILQANLRYQSLSYSSFGKARKDTNNIRPLIDFAFDIKHHHDDEPKFIDNNNISFIIDCWFKRLMIMRVGKQLGLEL